MILSTPKNPSSEKLQKERIQQLIGRVAKRAKHPYRQAIERRERDERRERAERNEQRPERDPMAVVEPQATPLGAPPATPAPDGPMLRDAEGGASEAPAFLQARSPEPPKAEGDEPARKPRRRRAPRSFEGGEGAAPPSSETEEA